MKKQHSQQQAGLFESKSEESPKQEKQSSSLTEKPPEPFPCPKCGGRSGRSVRPRENGGSRYCASGCLSEDKTDMLYFTPEGECPF